MKAQDIFGIIVRTIGLIVAVAGLYLFLSGLNMVFAGGGVGFVLRSFFIDVVLTGGGIMCIGAALMRWADFVVCFAYGKPFSASGLNPATGATAPTMPGQQPV